MKAMRIGGIVVAMLLLGTSTAGCGSSGEDRSGKDKTTAASKPSDVVKGYLRALASDDADKALGYLAKRPSERTFLTDKVLAKANSIAPLTDISVPTSSGSSGYVHASYKLGGEQIRAKFSVGSALSKQPRIDNGTVTVHIDDDTSDVTTYLNGAGLTGDAVELFPVAYDVTSASKDIGFGSSRHFRVKPREDDAFHTLKPKLTAHGRRAFKKAVSDAVADCLTSKKLNAGCGLKLSKATIDGYTIKKGSVTRSLNAKTKAALKSLKPKFYDPDDTSAEDLTLKKAKPDVRADLSRHGHTYKQVKLDTTGGFGDPVVDMTTKKHKVTWE